MELSEEKTRFVLEIQDKCYKLLRETHPKGSSFVDHIKVWASSGFLLQISSLSGHSDT